MVNKNTTTYQWKVTSKIKNSCRLRISILIPKQINTTKSGGFQLKILKQIQLKWHTAWMWDVANSAEESAIKTESTASQKQFPRHALILHLLHFKGHHGTHSHSTTSFSFCLHGSWGQTSRTPELLPNEQVIDQYCLFESARSLRTISRWTWGYTETKRLISLTASATASNNLISHSVSSCEVWP